MIKRCLSALALTCATALPLTAGNDVGTPVSGEILTGWQRADGTRIAALRLKLAPGWKTYWRSPAMLASRPNSTGPALIICAGRHHLARARSIHNIRYATPLG